MSKVQRLVWLLSMQVTAEMNNSLQEFIRVNYTTSEQHKESFTSRIKKDMKDTKSPGRILEFMDARNPFSDLPMKVFNKSEKFQQCASVFCDEFSSKNLVCTADEKELVTM